MADKLTKAHRSWNMSRIRAEGMKPELLVRKATHAMGYRYRLHRGDLPGKPDLVFPSRGKIIFVHGCFWHQHDDTECPIVRVPKSNQMYWMAKLSANVERDRHNIARLRELGWEVMICWECETRRLETLAERIRDFLESPPKRAKGKTGTGG